MVNSLRLRLPLVAGVSVLALAASGCGGDSGKADGKASSAPSSAPSSAAASAAPAGKTADQILAEAVTAVKSAESVRVKGEMTEKNETVRLDMVVTGQDAKGTLTIPLGGKPATAQIVKVGGKVYLKGRKFWAQSGGPQVAAVVGDRWVLSPKATGDEFSDFTTGKGVAELFTPTGAITREKDGVHQGKPVFVLRDSDGSTLMISAEGTPYPLRINGTGGAGGMDFAYPEAAPVKAPTNVLDLSKAG